MRHGTLVGIAAMAFHCGIAMAQAPQGPQRLEGIVTAASDTSLTLNTANGPATVALLPNRTINVTEPVAVDRIVPGSYVATANRTQADGTGVSTELRVYPPGPNTFNVNRAMDASGQLIMTNGTVATAVGTATGRVLTVNYGDGTRQIRVPPEVQVISNTPGNAAMVKTGTKLSIATLNPGPDGQPLQIITVAKADLQP